MILYLIIAPTLLKPEVWHELFRIVKIKWFKWLNVFHKDVDIEAVACVHNLQYRFSTGHAMLCISAAYASVRTSVRHVRAFCRNE